MEETRIPCLIADFALSMVRIGQVQAQKDRVSESNIANLASTLNDYLKNTLEINNKPKYSVHLYYQDLCLDLAIEESFNPHIRRRLESKLINYQFGGNRD